MFRIPATGGDPVLVTAELVNRPSISPDGTWLAGLSLDADHQIKPAIVPYPGGRPRQFLPTVAASEFDAPFFASDGALVFIKREGSRSNLWRTTIDGAAPTRVTSFDPGELYQAAWSRDGRLACVRGTRAWDVVSITGLDAMLPAAR
jgi:Tol biopolymer transport system component